MADTWDDDRRVKDSWEDEEEDTGKGIKESWDDEDDVKESWEDEEEKPKAKKPEVKKETKAATKSKEVKEMTEEEKKEAQLKADLEHTNELFGLDGSLNEFSLKTKEEYQDYINRFYSRVNIHNSSPLYVDFLDELFKTFSKNLPVDAVKKLSNSLKTIYDNKLAEERANKAKDAKPKQKAKARIKMEFDNIKGDYDSFLKDSHTVGYDDYDGDDFM